MRQLKLLILILLAACGSDNDGLLTEPQPLRHVPQVSNLSLSPGSVTYMDGGGSVTVTSEIAFSDAGMDIQTMKVEMSDGTSLSIDIGDPINGVSGSLTETFELSTTAIGSCSIEIWLVDAAGDSSNHLTGVIEVMEQPAHAPTISNLTISPRSFTFNAGDGTAPLTIRFDFEDEGLDIRTLRVELWDGRVLSLEFADPIETISGSLSREITASTAEAGWHPVEIWLIDVAGDESNSLQMAYFVLSEAASESDWLERASGLPNVLNDVLWNGSQFLAVGDGGAIMRSSDGIGWVTVASGTDMNLNAIAWDGSDYAVVGDAGTVLISPDGETWTLQYQGGDGLSLRAAIYTGMRLIAAGLNQSGPDRAVIMSSLDHGQTWTPAPVLPQSGRSITDIALGDSGFVATTQVEDYGDNGEARVLVSIDGLTWSEVVVNDVSFHTWSILWDGSGYWAGGRVGRVFYSNDGQSWIEFQTPTPASIFNGIAWSGTKLVADGENEWIGWGPAPNTGMATEDRGASWVSFTIAPDFDTNGMTWGNGRFVAVGCKGTEAGCAGYEPNEGGAIYSDR